MPADAEPNPAAINPTVLPLEVDARVPACGNLGVAGRQVWLGGGWPAGRSRYGWTGPRCTSAWTAGCSRRCRAACEPTALARADCKTPGRPGSPGSVAVHAVLLGPGDAVEVDRRVNAAGTVGVAGQQVSVGLPLSGQRVTLRLEAATMHVLADGALVRSLPSPVQAAARARLQGARLARGALVIPQGPVMVRRRASQRGQVQVAGERIQVGFAHARQVVTIHVTEREFRIFDQGGLIKVIPRHDRQEVTRFKAHKQHKPHGNKD